MGRVYDVIENFEFNLLERSWFYSFIEVELPLNDCIKSLLIEKNCGICLFISKELIIFLCDDFQADKS